MAGWKTILSYWEGNFSGAMLNFWRVSKCCFYMLLLEAFHETNLSLQNASLMFHMSTFLIFFGFTIK